MIFSIARPLSSLHTYTTTQRFLIMVFGEIHFYTRLDIAHRKYSHEPGLGSKASELWSDDAVWSEEYVFNLYKSLTTVRVFTFRILFHILGSPGFSALDFLVFYFCCACSHTAYKYFQDRMFIFFD
jgi:hypothetical protein